MAGIKSFRKLLNQVKLAWVSLILNIKSFFSGKTHTPSGNSSNEQNASNTEDEQDVWHDALEEQEQGEEEFFDAVESLDEQEVNSNKEYEKNKYYSLHSGLQEKTEYDHSTQTLALAFKINELQLGNCNPDLNKFKLCKLKQNGNKYTFTLEDNQKNRIELHSKYLNMYFPQYFSKCSEKRTYTGLFSPKENGISNDIIIPLRVPKEVGILTEKFGWTNFIKAKIQSQIPDFPGDIDLKDCKNHVNFSLNSNNTISLSITSMKAKLAATLSGTPTETNWPIKDVLVRGEFANIVNKHAYKQPEVEEVNSEPEPFEVVDVDNISKSKVKHNHIS